MRVRRASVADVIPFSWVDGPGNRFALFLQGCNFDCLACHNPQTIPLSSTHATQMSVDDVLQRIRPAAAFLSGVTVSGGEATVQAAFLAELFADLKADDDLRHLTTFIDSNGSASAETWHALAPVTDGVMVDLKAFDPQRHRDMTGQENAPVLDSITRLHALGLLYEVRLLPVPELAGTEADLLAAGAWLAALDPGLRVKINRFSTHGVRARAREWTSATDADMEHFRTLLAGCGLTNLA